MATYIVGDLQGCCDELQQLLTLAEFDPQYDCLYLVGDLVARGPKSLEALRFIKGLGESAKTVLGNHDLHLLAVSQGIHAPKEADKIQAILDAPDRDELLTWLRKQPLLLRHPKHNFVVTHAGISPQWTIPQAEQLAKEVEQVLRSDDYKTLLTNMYGNHPLAWSNDLMRIERMRYIINVFTRMRFCFLDGSLEFKNKLSPEQTDTTYLKPWFDIETLDKSSEILFGHWASILGNVSTQGIYALDTGCVYGNNLTMLRWEDKQHFSFACKVHKTLSS